MTTITIPYAGGGYDVEIGPGATDRLGERLSGRFTRAAVVTDRTVWSLHGARLAAALRTAGIPFEPVVLEPGEHNKSTEGLSRLYGAFADMRLRRDGGVLAFGGGVVGDLAGFAAATWLRGVGCVQIPTTLLAQVDSSVGGKSAINTDAGKNLAGAFYRPAAVVTDTDFPETLPAREYRCGMAEIIKYGAIRSRPLLDRLADTADAAAREALVAACCRIKAGIVERDERETGERRLLNFGHSFGHAIERFGGYEAHNHGEAVAVGMVLAARVGERLGVTEPGCADALRDILARCGLETAPPCPPRELIPLMRSDKKSTEASLRFILLRKIGDAFAREMRFDALADAAEAL